MNRWLFLLIGDPRQHRLEIRLFNSVSLLNGVANLVGSTVYLLGEPRSLYLFGLHLFVGLLFLGFYSYSRTKGVVDVLFWPFVLSLLGFLFLNVLADSGTHGGAHYYLIAGVVVATILTQRMFCKILSGSLFILATAVILMIQKYAPAWVQSTSSLARAGGPDFMLNMGGNLLFVELFTGCLVVLLSRTLDQEREKSDRLLRSILPEPVADELKRHDHVTPRRYESATVLFTDFVGFTRAAERLSPENLVGELDELFSRFDDIISRRKLEKIKTIGDAYMACGGLPEPSPSHAVDCVLAGLEMQRMLAELETARQGSGRPVWMLRVGIHSGPVVAGVIGHDKFAFDVWGDTVNTASRMETAGAPGLVNISSTTHAIISSFFDCEFRGKLPAKNKGEVEMFFVLGIRPELSESGKGVVPNDAFFEKCRGVRGEG